MRERRGAAFIVTLAILAGLVALLVGIAENRRTASLAAISELDLLRARARARDGIQRGLAELSALATAQSDTATNPDRTVNLNQEWARLGTQGGDRFRISDGSFRVQIVDASSFLDPNTATEDQLLRLPLTQEQVDSLLDFREAGTTARTQGAKDDYYNNLPDPYGAARRRLVTVDQLLLVRGWTPATLYQPSAGGNTSSTGGQVTTGADGQPIVLADVLSTFAFIPNTDPNGAAKVNVNAQGTTAARLRQPPLNLPQVLANQIAARKNWPGIGPILQLPAANNQTVQRAILSYLTTSPGTRAEGKINLNTATEPVLSTVPQLTPDMVQAILQRQGQGFTDLADLATVPGVSQVVLGQVADRFAVSSQTFQIRAIGESGSAKVSMEVAVQITNGVVKTLAVLDPPYADMTERWGWPTQTNGEIVVGSGQ